MRNGDRFSARRRLHEVALPAARRTGETNVMWTVFAPANVTLHAISVEADNGEPSQAIRLADQLDMSSFASAEREFTLHLELARCYEMKREDHAVLVELLQAERISPDVHGCRSTARASEPGKLDSNARCIPDSRKSSANSTAA